jgi:hypothetical protein
MPQPTDNHKELIKKLASVKFWADGLSQECQQTMELLEKEGVSTSSTDSNLSQIAIDARKNLRARFLRK